MYSTRICTSCLRVCKTKGTRVYFPAFSRYFAAVERGNGKSCIWNLLSFRRGQNQEFGLVCRKRQYSTGNNSLDSLQDHVSKIDEPAEENLDALTVGPPEELMQILEEEDLRNLKVRWMELEVLRQTGCAVPRKMSFNQWHEALETDTRSQRLRFYRHLCIKEARKEEEMLKKKANNLELENARAARELAKSADPSAYEREYGRGKNTIFLRIDEAYMNVVYNSWQCQAHQFGQTIVVDLGFDEHMVKRDASNCAKQVRDLYGVNKRNRKPYHLHFCNANPDSQVMQFLQQFIPNLFSHTCMASVTEKSYLDVFPKEKLVYLTPHCKNDLTNFDHDTVYIIGGLVDKTIKQPFSMSKAQREGITMARLPLDHYLEWGSGTKSLSLDQMMRIMLSIKNTNCWNTALKNVPQRKLKEGETSAPGVKPRFRYRTTLFADDD